MLKLFRFVLVLACGDILTDIFSFLKHSLLFSFKKKAFRNNKRIQQSCSILANTQGGKKGGRARLAPFTTIHRRTP